MALASNFVSGMIMVALALVGPKLIKVIPSSALVVPVAGMCFAFLGLEQASTPLGAPLVGFMVSERRPACMEERERERERTLLSPGYNPSTLVTRRYHIVPYACSCGNVSRYHHR